MSSVESLSWHTAASDEIIDVEDVEDDDDGINPDVLTLKSNNINGSVSDNYESSKFIKLSPKSVNKITTQNNCQNDSLLWTAKTGTNLHCIQLQLKIPWIIILISVIQIVVHYAGCDNTFNALIFTPTKKHELWRYFTYDFLHSEPVHLYSNVILQILVATPLEAEQGHFRVLAIYAGGVLLGALGSALANPQQSVVGASAGVYSLLISHISHGVLNWSTLPHRIFRIVAVVVMCCSDIIFIIAYGFFGNDHSIPKISFAAHGCGALAGFLFGFAVFHRHKECSGRYNYYRLISIILLICIIAALVYILFE